MSRATRPWPLSRRLFFPLLLLGLLVGGLVGRSWVHNEPEAALLAAQVGGAKKEGLEAPRVVDRQVMKMVSALMKREHLSKHPIDDEISKRGLKLFLKNLDGQKLYFYQSDVDEFMKYADRLDDDLLAGDISFAYTVFKRLLERVDERVVLVNDLLQENFDLSQNDVLITDPEKLHYPKSPEEAKDRWRKRLKYDLLILKNEKTDKGEAKGEKLDPAAAKERLARRYNSFAKRMHQTDGDELLEIYLTSLTMAFDPHSTYMSPSSLENFRISMSLNLEGIGAALSMTDGYTVISKLIPGGAAEKSKELKVEDRIVSVGQGENGEMVDVADLKLNDVVKLIRGKAGTVVKLGVVSPAGGDPRVIKIVRAKIELTDSEARGEVFEDGKKQDGTPFKIGVIDLPSFYMDMESAREGSAEFKSTTRDVKKIIDDFNKKGVDALVLDLRKNGGGSLTEAINLTGLFIDEGPVVQVKDSDGRVQHYDDLDRGMAWKGPLVVLTSKFSASASEILAGAIQDYHRGIIIGDTSTHGKGTVQSLLDLGPQLFKSIANPPNLGALKLTMQQFYRPNGDSTQKRGVVSDLVLPSLTDHMKGISESDLDYPLEFDKVPAANFEKYQSVNEKAINYLKGMMNTRLSESEDFAKLNKNIERYDEQREKKEVPLNEQKFLARRAELDADKEEEKELEEAANGKDGIKRDFYLNEVLNVTVDYLKLLGKDKVAQAR